jgi:hypothetical protein
VSNYSVDDLHRSLRRFVWQALPEDWRVRTERQDVTPDERELCVVEAASGVTTTRARVSIPQGNVTKLMAFSAMAYPALGTTARESRLAAQAITDLLDAAFTYGLVEDGANIGAPFRLPVYDFAGVPVSGKSRAGPDDPYGYAWVDSLSVRAIQDGDDHLRFTVACDLRLSWEAGGRVLPAQPAARSMDPVPQVQ